MHLSQSSLMCSWNLLPGEGQMKVGRTKKQWILSQKWQLCSPIIHQKEGTHGDGPKDLGALRKILQWIIFSKNWPIRGLWILIGHFGSTFNKNNQSVRDSSPDRVYRAHRWCSGPRQNSKFQCHWAVPETRLFAALSLLKKGNTSRSTADVTARAVKARGLAAQPLRSCLVQDRRKNRRETSANTAQITHLFKNTHANAPHPVNLELLKKTHFGWPAGTVFHNKPDKAGMVADRVPTGDSWRGQTLALTKMGRKGLGLKSNLTVRYVQI